MAHFKYSSFEIIQCSVRVRVGLCFCSPFRFNRRVVGEEEGYKTMLMTHFVHQLLCKTTVYKITFFINFLSIFHYGFVHFLKIVGLSDGLKLIKLKNKEFL